jgi:hypothetical protein
MHTHNFSVSLWPTIRSSISREYILCNLSLHRQSRAHGNYIAKHTTTSSCSREPRRDLASLTTAPPPQALAQYSNSRWKETAPTSKQVVRERVPKIHLPILASIVRSHPSVPCPRLWLYSNEPNTRLLFLPLHLESARS